MLAALFRPVVLREGCEPVLKSDAIPTEPEGTPRDRATELKTPAGAPASSVTGGNMARALLGDRPLTCVLPSLRLLLLLLLSLEVVMVPAASIKLR